MKKIYAYPSDIKSGLVYPSDVDVMAYEEYDGEVRITMFFKEHTHVIVNTKEDIVWNVIGFKIREFPEYYRSFFEVIMKKLKEEKSIEQQDGWTETQVKGVMQQYNLLDMSDLVEDRVHFEEALALLNNLGKRYRLQVYNNGGAWHVAITNNDSPYPSFSIALHVFLTKMESYMTKNSKDVEYKDI